jgi:hypothetical protein
LDKKAREQNERNKLKATGFALIYSEDIETDKLREVAAGMSISGTANMSRDELQSSLFAFLESDPEKFINNWESSIVTLRGLIQIAIDKGLLVYEKKNGVYRWYLLKDEVCIVGAHEDSRVALENAIKESANTWLSPLKKAVQGKESGYDESAITRALAEDDTTLDKLNLCLQQDVITYDRGSKAVYSIKGGELGDKLADVTDPKNWKQEIVDKIDSGELSDFVQGRWLAAKKKQKKELENADNA